MFFLIGLLCILCFPLINSQVCPSGYMLCGDDDLCYWIDYYQCCSYYFVFETSFPCKKDDNCCYDSCCPKEKLCCIIDGEYGSSSKCVDSSWYECKNNAVVLKLELGFLALPATFAGIGLIIVIFGCVRRYKNRNKNIFSILEEREIRTRAQLESLVIGKINEDIFFTIPNIVFFMMEAPAFLILSISRISWLMFLMLSLTACVRLLLIVVSFFGLGFVRMKFLNLFYIFFMFATVGFFFINIEGSLIDEHRNQYPANNISWVGMGIFCGAIFLQSTLFIVMMPSFKISRLPDEFIVKRIKVSSWSDGKFIYQKVETIMWRFKYLDYVKNGALLG